MSGVGRSSGRLAVGRAGAHETSPVGDAPRPPTGAVARPDLHCIVRRALRPAQSRLDPRARIRARRLTTRPFVDFIHPEDLEATLAEVDKQAETGQLVFNFQNRYRCADDSYRWLEWTSRPDYKAGLMFAVARDVTERKQAEAIGARHQ